MVKRLVKKYDKLTFRAKEFDVTKDEEVTKSLVEDLGDTLKEKGLIFLTSNQIGRQERAIALNCNGEVDVYLNPAIIERKTMIIFREKDYVSGNEYFIPRFTEISLAFQTASGEAKGIKFNEVASIAICQAIDMLNGIQTSDYGLEITEDFDKASDEEKQEVLAAYIQSFDQAYKDLDDELTRDIEANETWRAAKFIDSIAKGETKLEEAELSNRKKKRLAKFLKSLKRV